MKTCGLDVHKDTIFCAIYEKEDAKVEEFPTFTPSLEAMCEYIKGQGVDTVAMESTGIYIEAIRTMLRRSGLRAVVVNPYLIRQMPGRKSDVKDSIWIAKLASKQMLSPSFVPDGVLAELRTYTRAYARFVQRQTQTLTAIDRILVSGGVRLSSVLSSVSTKSFLEVAKCVADGEDDPEALAGHIYGRARKKPHLKEALTGCVEERQRWQLRQALEELRLYQGRIAESQSKMEGLAEAHYHEELRLVETVPGISRTAAICIIAEIGTDMSAFATSGRLCGWAGLRPRNDESAGKYKSTATTKGNSHLKPMLVQCAWGAVRTRGSKFESVFRRLSARKSSKKAIIAVARKLLVTVFAILDKHQEYCPDPRASGMTERQLHSAVAADAARHSRERLPESHVTFDPHEQQDKAGYLCGSASPQGR